MKRIFAIVMLILALCCSLAACGDISGYVVNTADPEAVSGFVKVADVHLGHIVYDPDTMVMYIVSDGSYNRGTYTVMVNADGTPKLWGGARNG